MERVGYKFLWIKLAVFQPNIVLSQSLSIIPTRSSASMMSQQQKIPLRSKCMQGRTMGTDVCKVEQCAQTFYSHITELASSKRLPTFKKEDKAELIIQTDRYVFGICKVGLSGRLGRAMLIFGDKKVLPLKIIQGMQWYLGFPDDFLTDPENNLPRSFEIVEMGDGLKGLALNNEGNEKVLSVMQRNAMKRGVYGGGENETIEFPTFPSKGLRLRRKIIDWYDEFQKLPYVSPYENCSAIRPDSETAEKRVVGLLHELLSLFVEHSAERRKLLCLRKYLGLPQKVHKAFERHPHIFYLSLKNKTCTAILKEAYCDKGAIEVHPLAKVRKKYINLVKESAFILKSRRFNNRPRDQGNMNVKDLDCTEDENEKTGIEAA
nr:protein ROOT PRIMORDIUM DEFECTIVE 1 [Ipomoea batatas]